MLEIALADQTVHLFASGAAFLPALSTLLIADAHFGKAHSFRRLNVPVPHGTTLETLGKLEALLLETACKRVVFLGDFLHSQAAQSAHTQSALAAWRTANAELALTLVRGNHDSRAGDPPPALGIDIVDEPLRLGNLALCHHPQVVADAYVLAGHLHPCVRLTGRGRESLRLPCFWLGDEQASPVGVLPAFGSFTGMHPIERHAGDRVFAVAGEVVREVPAGSCPRLRAADGVTRGNPPPN
jgi:uncharacterized protein